MSDPSPKYVKGSLVMLSAHKQQVSL